MQFKKLICPIYNQATFFLFGLFFKMERKNYNILLTEHTQEMLKISQDKVYRGVESFISANQFQFPRTWYVISEKLYFTFMV